MEEKLPKQSHKKARSSILAPEAESDELDETDEDEVNEKEEKEDKKDRLFPILLLFWGIALMLMLTMFLHRFGLFRYPWEKKMRAVIAGELFPGEGEAKQGHLPNMSKEDVLAQMQKAADESYFSFKINARPEFVDGHAKGNLGIENPGYNIYPMVVQITLDDSGEIIYDSGGILPNHHIEQAKLLKVLTAGTYRAIAHIYVYDPDTKKRLGEQRAVLEIKIKQ
jgi:hypothetical protein